MDIGSLLLALALFLIVAAFVARPIFDRNSTANNAPSDSLIAQREAVLIELRDLDFDHQTGKVSDDDYTEQRARLVVKGAGILRQLESLGKISAAEVDDEIEKAIAARRKLNA